MKKKMFSIMLFTVLLAGILIYFYKQKTDALFNPALQNQTVCEIAFFLTDSNTILYDIDETTKLIWTYK